MKKLSALLFFCFVATAAFSQIPRKKKGFTLSENNSENQLKSNTSNQNSVNPDSGPRKDSLGFEHRDDAKDSIAIYYKWLDASRRYYIDSSINDFDKYFSVPSGYVYLGNNGAAAHSLIFQPNNRIGFDPGFHAFDIYKFSLEGTKMYKTTKPFTSLNYQLASGKEQMLTTGHTQNLQPNLNIGFDYKLITAPGFFVTQNNNHNSYRIFSNYEGTRKRYHAVMSMFGNNIRASENGGIQNTSYLSDPNRKDRFTVPVNLGSQATFSNNPFITTVLTGNHYRDFNFYLRQGYDFGKHDSIAINDSTTEYLFYPKLRIQYTFTGSKNSFNYGDLSADSSIYANWYGLTLKTPNDTISFTEKWNITQHDFSLVQFPDTKNLAQFFLAGVSYQKIVGVAKASNLNYDNLILHAEYRNRTRNKRWDMLAKGEFYTSGLNQGDFNVYTSIERDFNKKFGNVNLFFNEISRTPSFIFNSKSTFNFSNTTIDKKENIISFGAVSNNPIINLGCRNHLLINYSYFKNHYQSEQNSTAINLLQLFAAKKIKLSDRWFWHAECTFQQTGKNSQIRVPLIVTRNRFAYEGVFFKNLILSTGVEARYYSAYKANGYSPMLGQFFVQDTTTIKNLPDISLFAHFRIKGFAGFLRAENLNTAQIKNGLNWMNNNFAAPLYPTQGLIIRFGVQWWFVN